MSTYMTNAYEILILIALLYLAYFYFKPKLVGRKRVPIGKKNIPVIPGGFPIIGHAWSLSFNGLEFLKECFEKHGPIFEINLFTRNIVVICDHDLARHHFNAKQDNLLFELASFNLDWTTFSGRLLNEGVNGSRLVTRGDFDKAPAYARIAREVHSIIEEMKTKSGDRELTCNLDEEMNKFVLRSIFAGFIPMETTEKLLMDLTALLEFSKKVAVLSLVFPPWFLKLCFGWRVRQLRRQLLPHVVDEIQKYRDDQTKCDCFLIRLAVDFGKDKPVPSNREILEVILSFIFSIAINIPGAVANTLLLLSLPENRSTLDELRNECTKCSGEVAKILTEPLLKACVTETTRLTAQLLMIPKSPVSKASFIGDYQIGENVHLAFLSGQMLHVYGDSSKFFHEPTKFKPQRFLGKDPEPQSAPFIISWGGGQHLCPGKSIGLNIVKITVAQLILHFNFKVKDDRIEYDFNKFGAFGRQRASTYITEMKLK